MSLMLSINLKRFRKAAGLTQRELTKKSGASSVAMIEAGQRKSPAYRTLRLIARVLGVTIEDLYLEDVEEVLEEMDNHDTTGV